MWKKIGNARTPFRPALQATFPTCVGQVILFFITLGVFLYAADIEITTAVDRQAVPVNQTVQYTLSVDSAADIPGLNLPAMNDFVVVGQSSATQIQIINGKQTGSRAYIYVLQPKKQGKAIIPGFSFMHKQQKYFTKSIEITVGTPEAAQQAADPFSVFGEDDFFKPVRSNHVPAQTVFLEMVPQKRTLYVGEKTLVELRFYFERGFYQGPQYRQPSIKGLVSKTVFSSDKPEVVEYQGKRLQLLKIIQEVYPLTTGTAELGQAQMQYVDSPFGGVKTLQTQPITFKVKPLPPPPADFTGATGVFSLQALPIPTTAKTGTAIPITIKVSGQGNLDMINTLPIPPIPSCNLFLDGLTSNAQSRTYKYFVTPLAPGQIALPEITFTYFDIRRGAYQTAKVQLPKITVTGEVIQDKQGQPLEYTDSAINIRVDRHLFAKILHFMFTWVLGLALLFGVIWGLYTLWQAPRRKILKRLQALNSAPATEFYNLAQQLFVDTMLVLEHCRITGLTSEQINQKFTAERATVILKLVHIFEELRYAKSAPEPDKQAVLELLKQLCYID